MILKKQKGQALIEAVVASSLLCGLFILMLKGAYLVWAVSIIDRETHRMVICGLTSLQSQSCKSTSARELQRLIKWGKTEQLDLQLSRRQDGFYLSSGKIYYRIFGLAVHSRRRLSEANLTKASQRWRY